MIAIAVALLVAVVIRSARVPLSAVMNIGLVFEVAGSYGIAAAEFADPGELDMHRGAGTLLGRRVDRAVHGRGADPAAPGA